MKSSFVDMTHLDLSGNTIGNDEINHDHYYNRVANMNKHGIRTVVNQNAFELIGTIKRIIASILSNKLNK